MIHKIMEYPMKYKTKQIIQPLSSQPKNMQGYYPLLRYFECSSKAPGNESLLNSMYNFYSHNCILKTAIFP